jgi:hypothetical protein
MEAVVDVRLLALVKDVDYRTYHDVEQVGEGQAVVGLPLRLIELWELVSDILGWDRRLWLLLQLVETPTLTPAGEIGGDAVAKAEAWEGQSAGGEGEEGKSVHGQLNDC